MRNTRAGSLRPSENPPVVSTSRASAPSDRLTRATAGQPSPPDGRTVVIVPSTARRLTVAPCRENNFAGWPNDEVVDRVNLCQFYEWAIGSPATVNGDGEAGLAPRVSKLVVRSENHQDFHSLLLLLGVPPHVTSGKGVLTMEDHGRW